MRRQSLRPGAPSPCSQDAGSPRTLLPPYAPRSCSPGMRACALTYNPPQQTPGSSPAVVALPPLSLPRPVRRAPSALSGHALPRRGVALAHAKPIPKLSQNATSITSLAVGSSRHRWRPPAVPQRVVLETMPRPLRLQSSPVRMPSKNFLARHQLDIHLWTEFLCTLCRQHCPFRLVYQ